MNFWKTKFNVKLHSSAVVNCKMGSFWLWMEFILRLFISWYIKPKRQKTLSFWIFSNNIDNYENKSIYLFDQKRKSCFYYQSRTWNCSTFSYIVKKSNKKKITELKIKVKHLFLCPRPFSYFVFVFYLLLAYKSPVFMYFFLCWIL